jgi:CheY-like chemotaxis protein
MRSARVLVVEDCPDTAATLAILLRLWGHVTCEAHSGPEAVQAACEFEPDVAILDIGLPKMDGFEVATQMRRQCGENLLLVALTGYASQEYRERSYQAGFDHYLVKPIMPDALRELLAGECQATSAC